MKLSDYVIQLRTEGLKPNKALIRAKNIVQKSGKTWGHGQQTIFENSWNSVLRPASRKTVSKKRNYAISDIHGCFKTFKKLLRKIKFDQDCVLYLLGDYVDRGPESKQLIDWIIANKANVVPIMGNHEQLLIESLTNQHTEHQWIHRLGGLETLDSFGVTRVQDIPSKYIQWIKKLRHYVKVKDHVFVHGGIDFSHKRPFRNTDTCENNMMWDRDAEAPVNTKMVVGHTPASLHGVMMSLFTNKIRIDGGCVYGGNLGYLVCYDIDNGDIEYVKCIDTVDDNGE